jgi:hypothetical protein
MEETLRYARFWSLAFAIESRSRPRAVTLSSERGSGHRIGPLRSGLPPSELGWRCVIEFGSGPFEWYVFRRSTPSYEGVLAHRYATGAIDLVTFSRLKAEAGKNDPRLGAAVSSRFSAGSLLEFSFRNHANDPMIPPGTLLVHLVPRGPEQYNGRAGRFLDSGIPTYISEQVIEEFVRAQASALQHMSDELAALTAAKVQVSISYGGLAREWPTT